MRITAELRNGLSRYRHAQETGLNAAVPECIEVALRALERKEIPLPVRAQFMAPVGWLTEPLEQALLRRACVEQRIDRRLHETEDTGDRLCISPGLEVVMVGTHRVHVRGGLVDAIGKRHAERYAGEPFEKGVAVRVVVGWIDAIQDERIDL